MRTIIAIALLTITACAGVKQAHEEYSILKPCPIPRASTILCREQGQQMRLESLPSKQRCVCLCIDPHPCGWFVDIFRHYPS